MKKRVIGLVLTGLVTAVHIYAEENRTDGESAVKADEIVISASKLETSAEKSGLSVTVIGKDKIEKSGASKVYELLREQAGISVSSNSAFGGTASVFIRGADSGHTVVLIDGVKVNDPTSTTGGFDFANLPLNNIERIEIIRGSQSVVHGSDALGGVINIVTRKAPGSGASVSFGYGRYNNRNASGSVYQRGENTDFSMGLFYEKADGFSKAKAKKGDYEKDGYRNLFFNADGTYHYSGSLAFEIFSSYGQTDMDLDAGAYKDDPDNIQKNNAFTAGSRIIFSPLDIVTFRFTGSYFRMEKIMRDDADSDATTGDDSHYTFRGERKKGEASIEVHPFEFLKAVAGYEYEIDSCENSSAYYSSWTSSYSFDIYDHSAGKNSVYVMSSAGNDDYFGISGGFRYSRTSGFDSAGTWQVSGWVKMPATDTKFRASCGTGFKSPTLYQLYGEYGGNRDLKSEKSIYYDAGISQKILKFAKIEASCFYSKFKNRIDWIMTDPMTYDGEYKNINRSTSKGIELYAELYPVRFVTLFGNYTYCQSKDTETEEDLLKRPRHKYEAGASLSAADKLYMTVSVSHVGARNDVDDVRLDPYSTLNAAANYYLSKDISIYIRGDNILNREYEETEGYDAGGLNVRGGIRGNF